MRTLVDIPEEHLAILNRLSKSQKVSRAELVRRAVETYIEPHKQPASRAAFGLWKDRDDDGLAYQERMRAEWDR
jgi:metal-responsive CopG/Arc/MetJ family transcriptional regulator